MAMDYNPDPNTVRSPPPPPVRTTNRPTWAYIAVGVLLLAIVVMFATSGDQTGNSTTSGTPPVAIEPMTPPMTPPASDPAPVDPVPAAP